MARKEDFTDTYSNFKSLLDGGHAVQLDKTYSHDSILVSVRIIHYLTCPMCTENREKYGNPLGPVVQAS